MTNIDHSPEHYLSTIVLFKKKRINIKPPPSLNRLFLLSLQRLTKLDTIKMFEYLSFEALAHYIRGMATMFFLTWAVITYSWRKRDRMTFLLFVAVSYVAFGYVKDVVFLFNPLMKDAFVENLVGILDVTSTPLVSAFFLEATAPGTVSVRRLTLSYLLFAAFVPLYWFCPVKQVLFCAYLLSAITALLALVVVPFNVVRYNKYLAENYSYTQDINVSWVVSSAFCYFLWFFVYVFCFCNTTWLSEVVFDVFSIIIWMVLCLVCRRHKVVVNVGHAEVTADVSNAVEAEVANNGEEAESKNDEAVEREKDEFIANGLQRCMEEEKIYLNPHLSLSDLASAVSSNKTYLSIYINRHSKTFYDYINEYRVAEACRIMEESTSERLPMADVAVRSGFNSISSFNRYFCKIKGDTPARYYRKLGGGEMSN